MSMSDTFRQNAAKERLLADKTALSNRKAMHERSAEVWEAMAINAENTADYAVANAAAKAPSRSDRAAFSAFHDLGGACPPLTLHRALTDLIRSRGDDEVKRGRIGDPACGDLASPARSSSAARGQATKRLDHCMQLARTFYTPRIRDLAFLRSQAELIDRRLIGRAETGASAACFEELGRNSITLSTERIAEL